MCVQVAKTANRFEISSLLEKILLKQVRWCLTFCRNVYIMNYHSDMQITVFTNEIPGIFKNSKCYDKE